VKLAGSAQLMGMGSYIVTGPKRLSLMVGTLNGRPWTSDAAQVGDSTDSEEQ
jgi:hypothetical protein